MRVILGFGDYHIDKGKREAENILMILEESCKELILLDNEDVRKKIKETTETIVQKYGKFNEKYDVVFFGCPSIEGEKGSMIISVPFDYSHYRTDSPLSPDGFACLQQNFIATLILHDWMSDSKANSYLAEGKSNNVDL